MKIANLFCDFRFLLLIGALAFIFIQIRLFATQSEYVDRIAAAVESESHCTSQMRLLIDQISMQQERVVALEEEKAHLDQECRQLEELVENLKRKGSQKVTNNLQEPLAAVVVMACNRADYLERTITSILKYQRSVASKFPLFISQDDTDSVVKSKALSYNQITYMQHLHNDILETERPGEMIAYYRIADHYKWALDELFFNRKFNRVIILEDDMEIAPDFFDYFEAMAALLDKDKTIMAVSSWNDNGQRQFVHDPHLLYRSDFFPGLGWMLTRSTWNELSPKWPKAYWDDWLRLKANRKDSHFIRPEVCRTYNFGEHGSSMGQFYKKYLEPIKMNDLQVDWKSMDLSYLMEDKYREHLADIIRKAKPIDGMGATLKAASVNGDVRINYKNQADFKSIARQFGVFQEWKDGIPRTAYKGVVIFRYQPPRRVILIGPDSLKQLGIEDA